MLNRNRLGFLALALVCIVSGAEARDTALIGGPGGGNFRGQCGAGQYLSGVAVRSGTLLDAVIPYCAPFNAQTGLIGTPGAPTESHGGNGGGPGGPVFCNNDQYVSGMMFGYTHDSQTGNPKYVGTILIQCKSIRTGRDAQTREIGANGKLSHGGFSCGDDGAAIGMIGRSGVYVDALGLICGPRPVAAGPVAPPPGRATSPPPPAPSDTRKTSSTSESGVDRPGLDYKNFDLPPSIAGFAPCQSFCESEANCKAWTFVKSGVQGPKARCWLKSGVPPPRPNGCCVSGVKAGH